MNRAKILVVEDHADTADCLARLLRSEALHVTVALDYRSALEVAKSERFDLLVCDIGLPDGDGCDLLPELRSLYGLDGMAVSAYCTPDDVERCTKAGYLTHVKKPATFENIREALTLALQVREDRQAVLRLLDEKRPA